MSAETLLSRGVAAIRQDESGGFRLYTRCDYEDNLGIYSFEACRIVFASEALARAHYVKTWPHGTIVAFDDLTTYAN